MGYSIGDSTLAIKLKLDNGAIVRLRATSDETLFLDVENGYVMALPHEPNYIELVFKVTEEPPMSELRDALNWLVHLHHGVSKGGDVIDEETGERIPIPVTDSEWRAALQAAERALEAPSEMQQFKERLYALLFEVEGEHPTSWFSIPKKHMEDLFAEFGCGEEAHEVPTATAGPTQMQQLVEWIDSLIDVDLDGDSAQQYGAHLVRDHIRTKFLGEGK